MQSLALPVILLIALAVRLWGIGFGLPYNFNTDEGTIIRKALAFGTGDLNPHSFHWPAFHLYVLFALYGILYGAGVVLGVFHSVADYRNLFFTDASLFYLAGRCLSALLGTATVYFVYRIATRMENAAAGLFAALTLALTYYHVWDSHIATLDVPATFWVTLCFALAYEIFRRPGASPKLYLGAGVTAGLAAATKYNAGIVVIAIAAAHGLRYPAARIRLLVFSGLAATAIFLATNPFIVIDVKTFLRDFAFQQLHLAEGPWGLSTEPAWRYYLGRACSIQIKDSDVVLFDPMALLLAGGALGACFSARRREATLLLVVPAAYLIYIGQWGMAATRYLDPVLPFLAIATGLWIVRLPRPALAMSIFALCFSLRTVAAGDLIRSRTDTRIEAKRWVEAHIPPKTAVAIESYDPPLAASPETIDKLIREIDAGEFHHPTQTPEKMRRFYGWMKANVPPITYDLVLLNDTLLDSDAAEHNRFPQTNYDLDRLKSLGVRYVIVNSFQYGRFMTERAHDLYPKRAAFYETLEHDYALQREFTPEGWRPGPIIRVYCLEASS